MRDQPEIIIAVKGFDPNWKCRGFQYNIGGTVTHEGEVIRCGEGGFHAIEGHPLEVFRYYPPVSEAGELNRFALVECAGEIARDDRGSKIAASTLTVKDELKIPELVSYAVKWVLNRIENTKQKSNIGYQSADTNTGYYSVATNTGDQSVAINTSYYSVATNTGDQSAATNTGNRSAATNTGYYSAATNTGNHSVATNTGNRSAATNTGYYSVATNTGDQSAATNTGDQSAAINTGDQSAAINTGDQSAANVEGASSIALAVGANSKAKASKGSGFVLCFRNGEGELIHLKAFVAGKGKIKPDTWYRLTSEGKPEEVEE